MSADVGRRPPRVAVVIPAHNEEHVISRCLRRLLDGAGADEFSVIVVSNGSTDRTTEVVAATAADLAVAVTVIELAEPGKLGAVRAGIDRAGDGPVIVLDADVELPLAAARAVARAIAVDHAVVASARLRVRTDGSVWLVRGFYRAWSQLPYVSAGMVGSGVFALSARALAEVGELPDVTNDDGWVRRSFPPECRVVVEEEFTAHAARTARALIARRARIVNGNRELDVQFGEPDAGANTWSALAGLLRARRLAVPDAGAFLAVTAVSRASATWRRLRHDKSWATDHTSRGSS